MLVLQAISGPQDQRTLLERFDPQGSTWVVSDLKTKLDVQRQWMTRREFLDGEAVLRASELWRILLSRLRPEIQIVSKEFAVTLISQELSLRTEAWAKAPGAAQTAYQYLCQLMPILSHPQGREMVSEWFETHGASRVRWGRWFDVGCDLWGALLERGVIAGPWVSGVLVNEIDFEKVWDRPLVFDLGVELNQVEADLIALMSVHVPISVLQPRPIWREEYGRTLLAYEILERKPKIQRVSYSSGATDPIRRGPREYVKFTTMLAEVKQAVARVREWLERESVSVDRIAIVAPDIEVYWPTLSMYLEQEGVPSQKPRVTRLHAFSDVAQWLATLRLKAGGHSESDLELSLFDRDRGATLSYDEFRTLYSAVYSRMDLDRHEEISRVFAAEWGPHDIVERDAFVAWSLKSVHEGTDPGRLELIFHRLFQECAEITRLSVHRWLTYLEALAARLECRVGEARLDGVACINLVSAENSPATHMILLGLTESALRQGADTGILFTDILSLAGGFGFHLQAPDLARLEFEARWIIENTSRSLVLSVPETDFDGAVQAPAWLWVKGARDEQGEGLSLEVRVPAPTRWDEIQRAPLSWLANERRWSEERRVHVEETLEEDLGLRPLPKFGSGLLQSVSASKMEDYLKCPFIFAAKNLFRLIDGPTLDLDLDPRSRGSLVHALFEILTREPMRFDLDETELSTIIDRAREQASIRIYDERLWPSTRRRYIAMARHFLSFEREWREQYPETRTLGREVELTGFLDPVSGELRREMAAGRLKFRGIVDRIDIDGRGNAAVIDYKPSEPASQYSSWIKNDSLQLLLYSMALENGLSEYSIARVVTAVFYAAKTMTRDKGFKVLDVEQGLYRLDDRKKNKISSDEKTRLFEAAREAVRAALVRMLGSEFAPRPKDVKICKDCEWSGLCRAPHLNT